jgi:hypothetical protein
MLKLFKASLLGLVLLPVLVLLLAEGARWLYGPVLAYKRFPSHDPHGPCWQGGCVREEAFWVRHKAVHTDPIPTRECTPMEFSQ